MKKLELCADDLVVGGGVGWSYDRRRAAHFSSEAAVWLYGQWRQTGSESIETAHTLNMCIFWFLQGSATSPARSPLGRRRRTVNCEYAFCASFTFVMANEFFVA